MIALEFRFSNPGAPNALAPHPSPTKAEADLALHEVSSLPTRKQLCLEITATPGNRACSRRFKLSSTNVRPRGWIVSWSSVQSASDLALLSSFASHMGCIATTPRRIRPYAIPGVRGRWTGRPLGSSSSNARWTGRIRPTSSMRVVSARSSSLKLTNRSAPKARKSLIAGFRS